MKIFFWSVGRSHEAYVKDGIDLFTKRISNYFRVEWKIISIKNPATLPVEEIKKTESGSILKSLQKEDVLVLLDEKGKQFTSEKLAGLLASQMNQSVKNLVFLVGGAYGVDNRLIQRANFTWCLSSLTLPHQIVRLILCEQVYRACTIIKNEKYHHS